MQTYEIIGFFATVLCVWMNMKEIIWGFPVAIVASVLYCLVFYQTKLYSDAGLQIIYIVLNFYGWYQWYRGDNKEQLRISRVPSFLISILTSLGLLMAGILGYTAHKYTDASIPYLDAATTATSLVAQWMLAKKYLENWLIWIVVDVVYVGMYLYKELYLTATLYFLLTLLAVQGYTQWKKSMTPAV